MTKILFKIVLTLLALFAINTLYHRSELQFMTLQRIDPIPHTQELIAEQRYAEAENYLGFFMAHDYVQSNPEAVALYQHIEDKRSSWLYQAGKLGEGILKGQSDETIGQVSGVVSDFLVVGDIRDLSVQGWNYMQGEEVDEILVALSTIGVAMSGAQVASIVGTAASAGTAAPTVAASTSAKTAVVTLKVARKLGKLPGWLIKGIKDAAVAIKQHKSIAPLIALFDDIGVLAKTRGGLELLSKTTDAATLKKMARFADHFKEQSLVMYRLGGEKIIEVAEKIKNTQAVKIASTFGKKGVAALDKLGADKFMQSVGKYGKGGARGIKIFYKHMPDIVLKILAALPVWLLALVALSGIAVWLPVKRLSKALLSRKQQRDVSQG